MCNEWDWISVVREIEGNEKRMAKLAALTIRARREKARGYVVAEAQKMGIRLSEDDIIRAAVRLAG